MDGQALGRFWEDYYGKERKTTLRVVDEVERNSQSTNRIERSVRSCKGSLRTAKPPFVGSIPTGASLSHKHFGPPRWRLFRLWDELGTFPAFLTFYPPIAH